MYFAGHQNGVGRYKWLASLTHSPFINMVGN